jgi:hypothetical protein
MEYEDQYDGSPARQVKPNTQFLSRMITGVTRGNQLAIDTNSSKAAQKVGSPLTFPVPNTVKGAEEWADPRKALLPDQSMN